MPMHKTYERHSFQPDETFAGDTLAPRWQVSIFQSTMADVLEVCNFTVFLERLGGVSDTVVMHRVGFSGDGWYEFVVIHESDAAAIQKATAMLNRLKKYPILDDHRFAQAEGDCYTCIGYVQNDAGEWYPYPA